LPGFGQKTEQIILQAITTKAVTAGRALLAHAAQYAEPLAAYLKEAPGVRAVEIAGSYRRAKETVADIDLLVTTSRSKAVIDRFVGYDEVAQISARGTTRATVVLKAQIQVDLRVVAPESYGAALHYFTGSKAHNIAIRGLGQQQGLKINEYGVFRGNRRVAGATELSVFESVGLPFIPPELREDRGEIEAARENRLPHLVELSDIKGDLHSHTTETDGRNSLREMAEAARALGYEYLAVTDHSQRVAMARGLDPKRLRAQMRAIDKLNEEFEDLRLLKGIEVDILENGRLDLPDSVLGELDIVVGSIHSMFNLPREKQTARVLKAMDHPHFSILGHPTGRLLLRREPYDIDVARIIRHARERGCFVELNAHPERLDLFDQHCRMAKEERVLVSIDTDAHSVLDFNNLRFGVGQARRGWLEKSDVLNTRSLSELLRILAPTMGRSARAVDESTAPPAKARRVRAAQPASHSTPSAPAPAVRRNARSRG
jgi:DNA polymerase (family 10)